MLRKPNKPCKYPGYPELTEGNYCKVHQREWIENIIVAVDHIKPHKGNEDLFYDINNLQSLCKSCHDRKTAKEDLYLLTPRAG
ncbi:MAG: HNH endonuclease [Epulopiscium sp.]|nr:HNH endonuclease [Candidatus Epulonipiscium sp.]